MKKEEKLAIIITIVSIVIVVVAILGFFIYLYLQTPEHKLELGANMSISDEF